MSRADRRLPGFGWLALAGIGLALLPWHGDDAGLFAFEWVRSWPAGGGGSAMGQAIFGGRLWLLPLALPVVVALYPLRQRELLRRDGTVLIVLGLIGLAWLL